MALKFSEQLFLSFALFYLGDSGFVKIIGDYLPKGSHGIINDLGIALSQTVPLNQYVSAGTLTIVGVITGLDGSGFSGISLAGSIANLLEQHLAMEQLH